MEFDPQISQNENLSHLQDLVSRVQRGELPQMSSAEVDTLDAAIEDGLISENDLRGSQSAA